MSKVATIFQRSLPKSVSITLNFFAMSTPTRVPIWMHASFEADRDKVFGMPTFIVDGEPFWGEDRIEWVISKLDAMGLRR